MPAAHLQWCALDAAHQRAQGGSPHQGHGDAIEGEARRQVAIVYTSYFGSDEGTAVRIDQYGTEKLLKASGVAYTILRDGMYGDSIFNAAMPAAIATGKVVHAPATGKVTWLTESTASTRGRRAHFLRRKLHLQHCRPRALVVPRDGCTDGGIDGSAGRGRSAHRGSDVRVPGLRRYLHAPQQGLSEFNVGGFEWQ